MLTATLRIPPPRVFSQISAQPVSAPVSSFGGPIAIASIPSTTRVGSPTFVASTSPYSIFIGTTNINNYLAVGTLSMTQQLGSRGSCTFKTSDTAGAYIPAEGSELIVYSGTTRLFGGIITSVKSTFENSTNLLLCDVAASDYGVLLDRIVARKHFDGVTINYTAGTMFYDLLTEFASGTPLRIGDWSNAGAVTGPRTFNYVTLTEAAQQLLSSEGLDFFVDPNARIHAIDKAAGYGSAPLSLTNSSANFAKPVKEVNSNRYANRVFVRSNIGQLSRQVDTFAGDDDFGVGFYLTAYILQEKPIVRVNGLDKLVVLWGNYAPGPHDFSYGENSWGVSRNPYAPPYTSSDVIEVIYPGFLQEVVMAEDAALVASQGPREIIIEVKDIADKDVLQAIANAELIRRKVKPVTLTFDTRTDGVVPGQLLSVTLTAAPHPSVSGSLIIDSVSSRIVDNLFFWHSITATNEQTQGGRSWERFAQSLISARRQPQDRITYKIIIKLAKTVEGLTNPGLVAGVLKDQRIAEKDGIVRDIVFRWDTPPSTNDVTVDIFKNGATIFGDDKLRFAVTDSGTVGRFKFVTDPLEIKKGDVFTAEVLIADDTAMDGTIEMTIQG